ncbi:hypothetical protein STEG23_005420, partial [Scotinomys teguina]
MCSNIQSSIVVHFLSQNFESFCIDSVFHSYSNAGVVLVIVSSYTNRTVTKTVAKVIVKTNPEKLSKHHMAGKTEGQVLHVLLEESVQK